MTKGLFLVCFLVLTFAVNAQNNLCLTGKIIDSESGLPLTGTTIIATDDTSIGTVSNERGEFILCNLVAGNSLHINYIGFETKIINIKPDQENYITILLKPKSIESEEVIIRAGSEKQSLLNPITGITVLNRDNLRMIPEFLGDADVIKSLQLTPGIQAANEGDGGIYVRGGTNGQNLVLLDGIPIYSPNHLFGFYSIFNPRSVSDVTLYKGAIPAGYGGRISSVIDIQQYTNDQAGLHGDLNLGIISSHATLFYSDEQNKIKMMISGRNTYLNFMKDLLGDLYDEDNQNFFEYTDYGFSDYNSKININLNRNNYIHISGYLGNDKYFFIQPDYQLKNTMRWGNKGLTIKQITLLNTQTSISNQIGYSAYNFRLNSGIEIANLEISSYISDYFYRSELSHKNNKINHRYGLEYIIHELKPNAINFAAGDIDIESKLKYKANEFAIYANYLIELNSRLHFMVGLRLSGYIQLGPYYQVNNSGNDTIQFSDNQVVEKFISPEPRFSINYNPNHTSSVFFSYSRLTQYIHQIPLATVSLPIDLWMISTKEIKPEYSNNFSLGYATEPELLPFRLSAESFYRQYLNQIELYGSIYDDYDQKKIENNVIFGEGESYGLEFSASKQEGKLKSTISYTLSKSNRQFSKIDEGRKFNAKYDRIHDIKISLHYSPGVKWTFSTIFVYATGNAINLPTQRYMIQSSVYNQNDVTNGFRVPSYHRLDLSVTRQIQIRHFKSQFNLSVYNVYNRTNPYFMYFYVQGDVDNLNLKVEPREVSLFPILPSISWKTEF